MYYKDEINHIGRKNIFQEKKRKGFFMDTSKMGRG